MSGSCSCRSANRAERAAMVLAALVLVTELVRPRSGIVDRLNSPRRPR